MWKGGLQADARSPPFHIDGAGGLAGLHAVRSRAMASKEST